MYNEDIKNQFVEETGGKNIKNMVTVFNNIGKVEEIFDTDVYYIPYDKCIDELFKVMDASSYKNFYDHLYYAKRYKEWCIVNGIFDESISLNLINMPDKELHRKYEEYLSKAIIKSPAEFHRYLDAMFLATTETDYMSMDDFLEMFFLMLYNGFSENDIFTLTIDDIYVVDNGIFIKCNNKMCKIEDTTLQTLLRKRIKNPYYGYFRGSVMKSFELGKKLIDFGSQVKNIKKNMSSIKTAKIKSIQTKLEKINPNYKTAITSVNLYICGTVYQIKCYEEANNCKMKKKELFEWFPKKEVNSRWRKAQIKTIYDIW